MSAPIRPAPATPRPSPPSPTDLGPVATARLGSVGPPTGLSAYDQTRSTPNFLRRSNVVLLTLVAAFAVISAVASLIMQSASTATADNTAPALVGIQNLFASVAEANTAATAAFLSARVDGGGTGLAPETGASPDSDPGAGTDSDPGAGTEDRVSRNLYEDAIQRAAVQAEEVSATIGPDTTAHRALGQIAVDLNRYAGRIEAARVQNLNDLPGADLELRTALQIVSDDIGASVATVTERGRAQLEDERSTGRLLTWAAVALGAVTLVALLWVQAGLLRRTNRILNPLLVVATALIATVVGYLVVGPTARAQILDQASEGGYEAIATTSGIQTTVFDLQSRLSLEILDGQGDDLSAHYVTVDDQIDALLAGADSDRERAAAETVAIRWARFEAVARQIEAAVDGGDREVAVALFQGEGASTFNGLNTSIESALSDNRDQFLTGVGQASMAVGTTPYLTIALPVLAALAILWAIQRRLGEYR